MPTDRTPPAPTSRPDPLARCRALVAEATDTLRATVPPDRDAAILALLAHADAAVFDSPHPLAAPGWILALRLCLERASGTPGAVASLPPGWAADFLNACNEVAEANSALDRCVAGMLQLQQTGLHSFAAWATSRRLSVEERERADFDWWSAHLAASAPPVTYPLTGYVADRTVESEAAYLGIGRAYVARFANGHSYPPDAALGGATFVRYADVFAALIGWLLRDRDRQLAERGHDAPVSVQQGDLSATIAEALGIEPADAEVALQPLILDRENAAYHSAPTGRDSPPLVRLGNNRLVLSARGLLGEPFIFLTRELRRRDAQAYHNSAHLREGVFRRDLYRLFADKRFSTSPGRIELKRGGAARTDLDAVVFDRKSGTLGIFELKSQDPFARSPEERQRQRDTFLHANQQVSAALEWVQRHGPDDLLNRFDERAARQFRVQKVLAFVLGRYLAHFPDGPAPDRRAAWGSWTQLLQLTGDRPFPSTDRNPLATLHAKLRDAPPLAAAQPTEQRTIALPNLELTTYPTFAAFKAAENAAR